MKESEFVGQLVHDAQRIMQALFDEQKTNPTELTDLANVLLDALNGKTFIIGIGALATVLNRLMASTPEEHRPALLLAVQMLAQTVNTEVVPEKLN